MPALSPLDGIHRSAGTPLKEYFACLLPERFTDPEAECRTAHASVALFDTNYRVVFQFEGPDRVRYLNAVATSNIRDLKDGEGVLGLLLTPQGHILAEMECYGLPDKLIVASHAAVCERTFQTLEKYIIMDDVTLSDTTPSTAAISVEGPGAARLVEELCGARLDGMADRAHCPVTVGGIAGRLVRASRFGEPGAEVWVERDAAATLWQVLRDATGRHGGGPVGYEALNTLRLEAGIPWFGYDFDDRVIPHEAALETSHISYTKGCYTGQEIVERVRSRGHVHRRRVSLSISGGVPARGAKLIVQGREVGHVTSAAFSAMLRKTVGMGYVHREHHQPGNRLEWDGGTAEVVALPLRASS